MSTAEPPGQHREHGQAAAEDEEPAPPVGGGIIGPLAVTIRS